MNPKQARKADLRKLKKEILRQDRQEDNKLYVKKKDEKKKK
jgi:hypothetical protein